MKNVVEKVYEGYVVIGRKFSINNDQKKILSIRGFVFNCIDSEKGRNQFNLYKDSLNFQEVSNIFNHVTCPTKMSKQLSECIPSILEQITNNTSNRGGFSRQSGSMDKRLILINRYIRNNFQKPLTLQVLADLIECNPIYLSNTYSKTFRIPPMKFVQQLRMKKAKELLITEDLTVGEIANMLGYVSGSQFSELFKKYYHVTPSQFRVKYMLNKK